MKSESHIESPKRCGATAGAAAEAARGAGFGVQGSGFRVQGAGFRVQGVGCRVQGVGCGAGAAPNAGAVGVAPNAGVGAGAPKPPSAAVNRVHGLGPGTVRYVRHAEA